MSRIDLSDNAISVLTKMADGNPGAINAMASILEQTETIDPQNALGGIGNILILDTWKIYGTDIYILWSDKCGKDTRKMLVLMRAVQLGLFSEATLRQMAKDQMRKVNLTEEKWSELDNNVCAMLENFAKPVENQNV